MEFDLWEKQIWATKIANKHRSLYYFMGFNPES